MQAMATEAFVGNMRGPVVSRADPDYDTVRSLYNGMIDKRPLLIARCMDVADVVTAVNFARENDLRVAIRGGGHNGPGLGSVDDGLMIDLSMMKGVRVDAAARTAAALMDDAFDPEKQFYLGVNRPLERFVAPYRNRMHGARNHFILTDLGRDWRRERGIGKSVTGAVSVWSEPSRAPER